MVDSSPSGIDASGRVHPDREWKRFPSGQHTPRGRGDGSESLRSSIFSSQKNAAVKSGGIGTGAWCQGGRPGGETRDEKILGFISRPITPLASKAKRNGLVRLLQERDKRDIVSKTSYILHKRTEEIFPRKSRVWVDLNDYEGIQTATTCVFSDTAGVQKRPFLFGNTKKIGGNPKTMKFEYS
eukprot:jgi/Bigna1/133441/aug1.21_g8149